MGRLMNHAKMVAPERARAHYCNTRFSHLRKG
jgi:hypothetical protein